MTPAPAGLYRLPSGASQARAGGSRWVLVTVHNRPDGSQGRLSLLPSELAPVPGLHERHDGVGDRGPNVGPHDDGDGRPHGQHWGRETVSARFRRQRGRVHMAQGGLGSLMLVSPKAAAQPLGQPCRWLC